MYTFQTHFDFTNIAQKGTPISGVIAILISNIQFGSPCNNLPVNVCIENRTVYSRLHKQVNQ